jgi:hypothetical protein
MPDVGIPQSEGIELPSKTIEMCDDTLRLRGEF